VPLIVWVYLALISAQLAQKSYIDKVVRYGRSKSFKVIEIGARSY